MVDAKLNDLERGRRKRRERAFERFVDMGAIGADLVKRGPGEHPAPGASMAGALGLVIAVEQEGVALVERGVAERMVAKDESLEEPGRVRKMPLGRRSVRERLDGRVGVG